MLGVWNKNVNPKRKMLFIYADTDCSKFFATTRKIVAKTDEFKMFGLVKYRYVFLNKNNYRMVK